MWAEYDKNEKRIRDFNNEFGKENIKPAGNKELS